MQHPDGSADPAWSPERTRQIALARHGEPGALMPILRDLLDEFGYIDPGAVPVLADVLNLSRAEVHGVITFYKDFRTTPPATVTVAVCRAEACQAVGATELAAHATVRLGVGFGQTRPDGVVSLDEVYCLGNCALGPSVTVNGRLYGRVDSERFDALFAPAGAPARSGGAA